MNKSERELLNEILQCPVCRSSLRPFGCGPESADLASDDETARDSGWKCSACGTNFGFRDGRPDFLLPKPITVEIEVTVGAEPDIPERVLEAPPAQIGRLPPPTRTGAIALDFGCGNQVARRALEEAGYRYVGVDAGDPGTFMWGDAHRLPLADDSIDLVYTHVVMEFLRYPRLAVAEVARVLRPGGAFAGTVGWMIPYVERAYFSHSYVAVASLLEEAGLVPVYIAGDPDWSGLEAQFDFGLFPRTPKWLARILAWPFVSAARIWWRLAGRSRGELDRRTSAAILFEATKT